MGEALFYVEPIDRAETSPERAGVEVPELRRALQRWGYVRDK
jgi:hypothetical protein